MAHKLHDDVRVFAMGFILDRADLEVIAKASLPTDFLTTHSNDGVQAFKWRATEHEFEVFDVLPKRDRFFVALHFYPWFLGYPAPPEVETIPNERYEEWNSLYGRHLAHQCEVRKKLYPHATLGTVFFLQSYLRRVVATHQLVEVLVPVNPSVKQLNHPIDPAPAATADPPAAPVPAADPAAAPTAIFTAGSTLAHTPTAPEVHVQPRSACVSVPPPQCKHGCRGYCHEQLGQARPHECIV
ncbi:hypothetical protein B0H11DRAFT_487306 [Mycena galericulata]|nr:hypothetical protein B0H11DRAFT_487306 [Mycena galericulata]